jgi:hypothetical protein
VGRVKLSCPMLCDPLLGFTGAASRWLQRVTTKTAPLASSPVSAGVTTSTQRAVLPLCCVADAVQIVVNLTADPSVLSVLVRGGLLPVLVPIAARAPSSVVAVSRKLSVKHCVDSAAARAAAAAASQVGLAVALEEQDTATVLQCGACWGDSLPSEAVSMPWHAVSCRVVHPSPFAVARDRHLTALPPRRSLPQPPRPSSLGCAAVDKRQRQTTRRLAPRWKRSRDALRAWKTEPRNSVP